MVPLQALIRVLASFRYNDPSSQLSSQETHLNDLIQALKVVVAEREYHPARMLVLPPALKGRLSYLCHLQQARACCCASQPSPTKSKSSWPLEKQGPQLDEGQRTAMDARRG